VSDVFPEPGTVIELIERDHLVLQGMLGRFDVTATHEWGTIFEELVGYALRHEIAEQAVVYPALRENGGTVDKVLDGAIADEAALESRFARMARLDPMGPDFREALGHLRDEIDAHTAREESKILPMLRAQEERDLLELARSYEVARSTAPAAIDAVVDVDGSLGTVESLGRRIREVVLRR
jgi:hypothetical protein